MNKTIEKVQTTVVITPEELLAHWQGHRKLTRRLIEAFPEKEFFNHSIGGMRPFAEMTKELLNIAESGLKEMATGQKGEYPVAFDHGNKKAAFLKRWDEATNSMNKNWTALTSERFHETITLFGRWENTLINHIFYFIDNEIHHRGQGYVYLRSLGIEPPPFWER